uniref:Uncharacterized protein n=1 Tax=Arundo donax TaxID=35708 RepID=A0A0A9CJ95_ARUDO
MARLASSSLPSPSSSSISSNNVKALPRQNCRSRSRIAARCRTPRPYSLPRVAFAVFACCRSRGPARRHARGCVYPHATSAIMAALITEAAYPLGVARRWSRIPARAPEPWPSSPLGTGTHVSPRDAGNEAQIGRRCCGCGSLPSAGRGGRVLTAPAASVSAMPASVERLEGAVLRNGHGIGGSGGLGRREGRSCRGRRGGH